MIEGKEGRGPARLSFPGASSRQEFHHIRLFLSSFPPHYVSAYQLILSRSQVLRCHVSRQDGRLQSSRIISVFTSRSVSSCHISISRGSNLSCENTHFSQLRIKRRRCRCLCCFPPYQLQTHLLSSYMPRSYQTMRWSCHGNHHSKPIQRYSITLSEFGEFLKLLLSVILPF